MLCYVIVMPRKEIDTTRYTTAAINTNENKDRNK